MTLEFSRVKMRLSKKKTAQDTGKSRGRSCRGSTTVRYDYNTTAVHNYIPYKDLKHYKKDKKTMIQKYFGRTDVRTGVSATK